MTRMTKALLTVLTVLLLSTVAWAAGGDDFFGFVATRIPFGASNTSLASSSALTFDSSTGTLTATKLAGAHNGTVGATTPAAGSFTTLAASTGYNGVVGGVTPAAGSFTALLASTGYNGPVGGVTPAAGAFTTLAASTGYNGVVGGVTPAAGTFTALAATTGYNGAVGGVTPAAGSFTTLAASTGYNGPVGGVTPAAGAFTTIGATDTVTVSTAGKSLAVKEGSNAKMGTATLNGSGWVTVSTTACGATSRVFVSGQTTTGACYVKSRVNDTSFSIYSTDASDAGDAAWLIVDPAP